MNTLVNLIVTSIGQVWLSLQHNWPYLLFSVGIAVLLKLYVNAEKVSAFLKRYRSAGVVAATAAAVLTPLCSCGTTAVILGMMAGMMPWAPVVAFMVASPLTSPGELVYCAGLFGWPFSTAFFLSSILLGLAGGWIASFCEKRGWLANQNRFASPAAAECACSTAREQAPQPAANCCYSLEVSSVTLVDPAGGCQEPQAASCACSSAPANDEPAAGQAAPAKPRTSLAEFVKEFYRSGKQLLVMFLGYAFIGYFLNGLIPHSWVTAVFGSGHAYSVPLAATLGLPLYINSEASLPLIRALLDSGMSQGAALAFMISGAGTSLGAIAGALTIARWRVVALVIGVLWIGAMLSGFAYDLALAAGFF